MAYVRDKEIQSNKIIKKLFSHQMHTETALATQRLTEYSNVPHEFVPGSDVTHQT